MLPKEVLQRHTGRFRWGTSDCVQFAADMVEYITGERPNLPIYRSKAEADLVLADRTLEDAVTEEMGSPVPVIEAEYGDVVLTAFPDTGQVLGVADPPGFWIRSDRGIMPVELNLGLKVFKCRKLQSRS